MCNDGNCFLGKGVEPTVIGGVEWFVIVRKFSVELKHWELVVDFNFGGVINVGPRIVPLGIGGMKWFVGNDDDVDLSGTRDTTIGW